MADFLNLKPHCLMAPCIMAAGQGLSAFFNRIGAQWPLIPNNPQPAQRFQDKMWCYQNHFELIMVGILLLTHAPLGEAFLATLTHVYQSRPIAVEVMDIFADQDIEQVQVQAHEVIRALDSGAGVLVFTDICGATPANCAVRLIEAGEPVSLVYGMNLPALLRAMCYRNLSLPELTTKVIEGGQRGVFVYQPDQGNVCPAY